MKAKVAFQFTRIVAALLLAGATHVAFADVLPGAAMPEQVSKSLIEQQPAAAKPIPQEIKAPEEEKATAASEEAKKIKFKLNGIILKGNKIIPTKELSPFYAKHLHKEIPVASVFTIVQEITNYYRNKGYILSRAILPPQHVKNGVIEIKVLEGYIDKVEVSGDPHGAKRLVEGIGQDVRKSKPLRLDDLEYVLTLENEIPATLVQAVMSPSKAIPGAADLILKTTNKPITGYFSYDNYGTRYIGPQQMTANIGFNSVITSGDSIQVTTSKTPKGGEMTFWDANYNMALGTYGKRLLIGSTRTKTHPLFVLRDSQIDGLNNNYYTTATFPIIRERTKTMNVTMGFNYLDTESNSFETQLYQDHVRSLDVGVLFSNADSWYGSNSMSANFRQGLPIWGYTRDTNPDTAQTSRPGGHADYTKLTGQISRLQIIRGPWTLYGLLKGQWAFNPLLSSEQFTYGGSAIGRGYDPAELIGDRGIAGDIELRYDIGLGKILQSLQLYTFYSFGEIWNLKTAEGTPFKLSGTSTGLGTRYYFTKYISGNFMWTQTLTKPVAAEELIGRGRRPRVWFSVIAAFM